MTTEYKVIGIDVSAYNITCCLLTSYPVGGLRNYWDKSRAKLSKNYPKYYSSKPALISCKSAFDFAQLLKDEKPDYALIEPTGCHYSRLWNQILKAHNVIILWVGHVELKRYRDGKMLPNKTDEADSLALAAYFHDLEHKLESGEFNPKRFLFHQPQPIDRVRELIQQIDHLSRVQSPIINHARQLLSWQYPEVASSRSSGSGDYAPPLWGWLSHNPNISKNAKTRINKAYPKSVAVKYGIDICDFTRLHAKWLCDVASFERFVDDELSKLLSSPQFHRYHTVLNQFGFGLRTKARLLSRIYPFTSFLVDGKQWCEHELRGDKKIDRNRSRDAFKLRLGMGTILQQSGDEVVEKPGGSSICRKAFWQYVLTSVETGKLPKTAIAKELIAYRDELKSNVNSHNQKRLNGKHIQSKLMSKTCNLLYREMVRSFTYL